MFTILIEHLCVVDVNISECIAIVMLYVIKSDMLFFAWHMNCVDFEVFMFLYPFGCTVFISPSRKALGLLAFFGSRASLFMIC